MTITTTLITPQATRRYFARSLLARAEWHLNASQLRPVNEQLRGLALASRLAAQAARYEGDAERYAHHMRVAARIAFVLESRGL